MPSTTVSDLKTAKRNKEVQIQLDIGDDANLSALTRTLQIFDEDDTNNTTNDLCNIIVVDCHEGMARDWSGAEVALLFDVIGGLDSIVHLGFENLGSAGTNEENDTPLSTFPVTHITTLLQRTCHRLETLTLDGVVLTATTTEELDEFSVALSQLRCLRSCVLTNNFDLKIADETYPIDNVVTAISQLPLLVEADLVTYSWYEEGYPFQFQHAEPLKGLFECPNLQALTLGEFNLANEGLKDVGRALATSDVLRRFELHLSPSRTRSSVPSLTLLANALKTNTTLEVFKLEFDEACPKLDTFLIKVAEALQQNPNSSLKKFKVTSPVSYGAPVEKAFVKLLQSNYCLEKVNFLTAVAPSPTDDDDEEEEEAEYHCLDASKRTEMDLYLRLNCRGRKELLQSNGNGVSRAKWVDAFVMLRNDLDALHYYVRMNPWLCHCDDPEPSSSKTAASTMSQHASQQQQSNDAMMQSLHQLISTGFQTTQQEIKKLNAKMDDMKEQHAREKRQLKEEVKRLRDELTAFKGKMGETK